ncbi:MAG TPA: ABC transporter substrate-binding protein [Tissierellia bacterium]|nr:ABC transporter substrate-binding protein [Tissierellia bacterium]
MNKYFDIKDKVYDITEKYPETIDVFVANGFKPLANESMRKTMGRTISLEMALKSKQINVEQFVQKLVDVIEKNRVSEDISLVEREREEKADIRIGGVLPCPVRIPLMEAFNKWLEEEKDSLNVTVDYELNAAAQGVDWLKNEIKNAESEEALSDLFISAGFDLFFDNRLMGKFRKMGTFEDITGFDKLNEDFDNEYISLIDPDREYSIIGVVPAVFLVNTEELEGIDMPTSWKDLFRPEFENRVSLPIGDFDLFNAILLNIYKVYGVEGVKGLKKALFKGMHPSEMVKSHMKKERPAVTIMPYFFTKMTKENGPMKAVWPKDGAIISPIFLLSKGSKKDKLKPFVDFFASKEVGEILAHNGRFPSTNPEVENKVDKDNKYMWLGWDYIKKNDIGKLIKECERIFEEA